MSEDSARIEHLKAVLANIAKQQREELVLDDQGKRDRSRRAVQHAQEITRLRGTR
jgi:hypothetical protein